MYNLKFLKALHWDNLDSLWPKMEKLCKDGETLQRWRSQQKQDQKWTVAQIMNFLLQNSDLNWRK